MNITIKPKEIPHEVIKRERAYYHPFEATVEFDKGEKITVNVTSSRCAQIGCMGNYEVSGPGDEDGRENTCSKCGTKVWGPVYINLEKRWMKNNAHTTTDNCSSPTKRS